MRALRGITLLDALVLLIALVTTWQKMSWEVAGRVTLVDLLQALFIGLFLLDRFARRDRRLAPVAITLMGFALLFLAVHLVGFLGLDTTQAAAQWTKGIVKWALFFGFVILAAAHIARRGVFLWVRHSPRSSSASRSAPRTASCRRRSARRREPNSTGS